MDLRGEDRKERVPELQVGRTRRLAKRCSAPASGWRCGDLRVIKACTIVSFSKISGSMSGCYSAPYSRCLFSRHSSRNTRAGICGATVIGLAHNLYLAV